MAMQKAYQRINWENLPSERTPIDEINLNKMDKGIDDLDDRIVNLDSQISALSGGGQDELIDFASTEKKEIGYYGNRPVYEQHFFLDSISGTESVITPDQSFYKLLYAEGSADHTLENNNYTTDSIILPYCIGDNYAEIAQDSSDKKNKKIVLRTDSVNYSNVNIATKYIGKIVIKNPCSWANGTEEEIKTMIEAHYEGDINLQDYWQVGEKRQMTLPAHNSINGAVPAITYSLVLLNKGGRELSNNLGECAYVVGFSNKLYGDWRYGSDLARSYSWETDGHRTNISNGLIYNLMPQYIKDIIKPHINKQTCQTGAPRNPYIGTTVDYMSPPDEFEVFGTNNFTINVPEQVQFEWFKTPENIISSSRWVPGVNDNGHPNSTFAYMLRSKNKGSGVYGDNLMGYWAGVDELGALCEIGMNFQESGMYLTFTI